MTLQRALFKSKRRGDSPCVIATRFTCSEPYVIKENGKEVASVLSPLASLASEPYVIEENGKEIASVLSTLPFVHGSSTKVQNRVQFKVNLTRTYEKLLAIMNKYVNLCETMKAFYVKELIRILCETNFEDDDSERDLGYE